MSPVETGQRILVLGVPHLTRKKIEMAHILAPSLADSVGCGIAHLSLLNFAHLVFFEGGSEPCAE